MKVVSELPGGLCVVEFAEGEREHVEKALRLVGVVKAFVAHVGALGIAGAPIAAMLTVRKAAVPASHPWKRHAERVRQQKAAAATGHPPCPQCGNQFERTSNRQVYCGKACKKEARNAAYREKHGKTPPEDAAGTQGRCQRCNAKYKRETDGQVHCAICLKAIEQKLPGTGHGAGGPGPDNQRMAPA